MSPDAAMLVAGAPAMLINRSCHGAAMRVVALLMVVALAGCVQPDAPADAAEVDDVTSEPAPDVPWAKDRGCSEVAGVSIYDLETYRPYGPPEPWVVRDIMDEMSNPRIGSLGNVAPVLPVTATGASGHWHTTVQCVDHAWGWVGVAIERPEWDLDGPERQFLLALWSLPEGELADVAADADFHTGLTEEAFVVWPPFGNTPSHIRVHQYLDDAGHGAYETQSAMVSRGSAPERVTRFWMQVPVDGATMHDGPWRPIAFDAHDTDALHYTSFDSTGFFSHTQTDMHITPTGGQGNTAAIAYDAFERTLRPGPAPDVHLPEVWHH